MKDLMRAGELYLASDPELVAERARAQALLEAFNRMRHAQGATRGSSSSSSRARTRPMPSRARSPASLPARRRGASSAARRPARSSTAPPPRSSP